MPIISFPHAPKHAHDIHLAVRKITTDHPDWVLEQHTAETGLQFLILIHKVHGTTLRVYPGPDDWAVLSEEWKEIAAGVDLVATIEQALHLSAK